MKKYPDSISFVIYFSILELAIFFFIYIVHSHIFKGFSFEDSFIKAGYSVFWRVFSLQLVIQFVLIILLVRLSYGYWVFILFAAYLAFSVAAVLSTSDLSAAWKPMRLPTKDTLGEGFAIVLSVIASLVLSRLILWARLTF